jgi:CO/xanthine dehydrogenase FAD-binding subunit
VKPSAFEYLAPESCDEAVEALSAHRDDHAVLAGGTLSLCRGGA